jgi:uncharacterized protein (TIGR04255 family)
LKEFPALINAPIREALIDVQFSPEISFEEIETKFHVVAPRYGALQAIDVVDVSIESSDSGATTHTSPVKLGYRAVSNDGLFVFQIRKNGLSMSRLRPYEHWTSLLAEFKIAWDAFGLKEGERLLTRIAVRYINEITLPIAEKVELDEFLTYGPKIPRSPPLFLNSFFSRNEITDPVRDKMVIVNQALVRDAITTNGTLQVTRLLLDIDTFTPAIANSKRFEATSLEPQLESLREVKNEIFYEHTTPKARGETA